MLFTDGDPRKERFYVAEIKDGKRNVEGTYRSQDGRIFRGEFKDDKLWNIREHLRGKLIGTLKNEKITNSRYEFGFKKIHFQKL